MTLPGRDVTVTIMHHYPEGLNEYNGNHVVNVRLSEGNGSKVPLIIGKWGYILFPETQGTFPDCPP